MVVRAADRRGAGAPADRGSLQIVARYRTAGSLCTVAREEMEAVMIDPAFTLEKKTAVVVGAANGIGRATALAFAAAGAHVACADVEEPGAKTTAAQIEAGGGQALPVHLDVTDGASCENAVAAAVQRFGGLDVLMYGAADSDRTATVLEMDEAAWDRVIRINLTGAFLMVRAAIPAMIARGGGSILLLASHFGLAGSPGR